MTQAAAIYALIEAIYGSQLAKDILGLFVKNKELTEEQAALIQSNHEDYQRRIQARS